MAPSAPAYAEALPRLHAGEIALTAASDASRALTEFALDALRETYGHEPQHAQFALGNDEFFARLSRLRVALRQDPQTRPLIRALLCERGCNPRDFYCDHLRLRAVQSGGHRIEAAREAYALHRDTWYANPQAQINWWLAVCDVREEESPAFFPEYFERAVANSSAGFDYARWKELGGWQSPNTAKHYPAVIEQPREAPLRFAARAGDVIHFAGRHLHGTWPHDSGRTRFSLEVRVVRAADILEGVGRNVDNESKGSAFEDYWRAEDFSPPPRELIEAATSCSPWLP